MSVPEPVEGRMLRRGLPRTVGGEAWPPALTVSVDASDTAIVRAAVEPERDETPLVAGDVSTSSSPSRAAQDAPVMRRGLPRVAGGEAWPPASAPVVGRAAAEPERRETLLPAGSVSPASSSSPNERAGVLNDREGAASLGETGVRRGLPRVAGGEAWPPAGTALAGGGVSSPPTSSSLSDQKETASSSSLNEQERALGERAGSISPVESGPLTVRQTVWHGTAPRRVAPTAASDRPRPTWTQAIAGLIGLAALGLVAVAVVTFVRALLSTPPMQDFLAAFPGEYHLPEAAEPGFAPWVGWQHFFNIFLMVLIIRSGLRVRTEKRPTAFWTPRNKPKGKISLALWFHQALDLLWIINGVIFVVLLFVTGHWMRIVPTSWEVFPNALSAGLQYVSLDWPTDNGWVNYNSLQQLAYFATVFIAAPLAAITGIRMSGLWPKTAQRLSKAYPVEWARALHFPVMLYFVAFIFVHVALVVLTGFLRNLNHMFAAQGSVDALEYAGNWTGFWMFAAAMAVVVIGWIAARPLVLAPIAKLFGTVSGR